MWKCTKCGKMVADPKKHHCLPELKGLGTQQLTRLRGSQIGRQVDGNVEVAYWRARQGMAQKAAKIIKSLLPYIVASPPGTKKKAEKFVADYL